MSGTERPHEGEEADMISDADLIDYLHDELNADAHARVADEIGASRAAGERLQQLRSREARLSELLHTLDPDELTIRRSATAARSVVTRAARPPRTTPLLRAAAIIVLLGGAIAFVQPVRALVADGLRSLGLAVGIGRETPAATPRPDPDPAAMVRTTFAWNGPVFTVAVPAAMTGRLELATGDAAAASVAHASAVPILVTPDGIRIADGTAAADLRILLPRSVATVRVLQGGRLSEHPVGAAAQTIELRARD